VSAFEQRPVLLIGLVEIHGLVVDCHRAQELEAVDAGLEANADFFSSSLRICPPFCHSSGHRCQVVSPRR
jgi:hypothetical protein